MEEELIKLLKSWCPFAYREFYRDFLVLLEELSDRT
jgi:hypothetical protein